MLARSVLLLEDGHGRPEPLPGDALAQLAPPPEGDPVLDSSPH